MELTRQQAEALARKLQPKIAYVVRVRERMDRVGFTPQDRLYQLLRKAEDALRHLAAELHYVSCASGVGQPPADG